MHYILQLGITIFAFSITLSILMMVLSQLGAIVYDFKQLAKQQRLAKLSTFRPLVSVVIPAHNEASVIVRCLESLLTSSYPHFEVIVVNDASGDSTKKVVNQFINSHPGRVIKIYSRKKNGGRGAAINTGIRKLAKGELVMAVDADCVVHPKAIANAVAHFADSSVAALAANVRIMEQSKILGLLQQFEYLVGFRAKKMYSLALCEYIIGGAGALYRRDIFEALDGFDETMQTEDIAMSLSIADLGNRQYRLVYASDVLVFTEPVPTLQGLLRQRYRWKFGSLQALYRHKHMLFSPTEDHTRMLSWFRLPLAVWSEVLLLLEPFFFSYFLLIAIVHHNPTLFISAWAVLTLLLCFTVWSDSYLSAKAKAKLLLLAPCMYLVFYIMTIVQVVAAIRCIRHVRAIIGKQQVRGAWISPERTG